MRFIPTRIHGIIDYIVGVVLILAPFIFGFDNGGAAMWVPIIIGAGTIVYSLMTNYELGVAKVINMRTHLGIDAVAGAFLAASPWLFGFSELVWLPHLLVGLFEIGTALTTHLVPTEAEPGARQTTRRAA